MSYALRPHTADVAVEATGDTLRATVAAVADGMSAACCEEDLPAGGDRHELTVGAEGLEALLFDYLDELIYERDVRGVLPVDNEATVSEPDDPGAGEPAWRLTGSYRGVPLSAVRARDLKAVTYSEMSVTQTETGWRAYVVFDV